MGFNNNEREPIVTPIAIGTMASSANVILPGIYFRKRSRIKNIWYVDTTGIALSASNYLVLTAQDNQGSPVTYATVATSASAAVARTQLGFTLANPVGDVTNQPEADVPAGTMLCLKVAGTGTAVPTSAVALVEWYPL